MAELLIDDESVTISLSIVEKVEALHGNLTVPRSSVTGARVASDRLREVQGLRAPGTEVPGLIKVGTYRAASRTTFAACKGHGPAVVLELTGTSYDRIVATVDDPEHAVRALS
jgi:hypothetical protein